jgi:hypothetical protein
MIPYPQIVDNLITCAVKWVQQSGKGSENRPPRAPTLDYQPNESVQWESLKCMKMCGASIVGGSRPLMGR